MIFQQLDVTLTNHAGSSKHTDLYLFTHNNLLKELEKSPPPMQSFRV
jgi:hypothetical protein